MARIEESRRVGMGLKNAENMSWVSRMQKGKNRFRESRRERMELEKVEGKNKIEQSKRSVVGIENWGKQKRNGHD